MRLMNNDLVSRSYLRNIFDRGSYTQTEEAILLEIDKAPTAYNLDKVDQELNNCMKEAEESWKEFDDEQAFGEMMAYQRAIKIVREAMNSE